MYVGQHCLIEKFILKEVLKSRLPASIISRPKNPYRAPIKHGLINANSELVERYLSESELKKSGLFDTEKIKLFLKKMLNFDKISEIDGMALIGLLSTQIIYDKFISNFNKDFNNLRQFDLIFDNRSNKTF
jgi:asparagine synthase (glutamine-hydrolysing)